MGTRLGQQDANLLRKVIQSLLLEAINWNALRISASATPSPLLIDIPNAAGNDAPARLRLPIAEDHRDLDGTLRRTLMALVRYDRNDRTWSYQEGDEDGARVANFIDGIAQTFTRMVETQAEGEIASLVH